MLNLICENPYELWAELTQRCLTEGDSRLDEKTEILELLGVAFHIKFPEGVNEDLKKYCDQQMIGNMIKNFNTLEPQFGYKFSYGERIFGVGSSSPYYNIKSLLERKPESKSATICLIREDDVLRGHVPCIATIDFKIRDGAINLYYFARSQDIFKKSYADNIALTQVQKRLAADLNLQVGFISGVIASAHIYKSDLPKISTVEQFKIAHDA